MEILESGRRNIVVLGAGFGGITALLKLHKLLARHRLFRAYNLVLVNRSAEHLYTPALYEVASTSKGQARAAELKGTLCVPIEAILTRLPEVRFIGEEIIKLDPRTHVITARSGNLISFEYALIALGAETNFFNIPGLAENALTLKTFEDAAHLRNKVEELTGRLAGKADGARRIVVAGAGPTGVELAAELANSARRPKKAGSLRVNFRREITMVESAPNILPGFAPTLVRRARNRLKNLGVEIVTGFTIKKVTAAEIVSRENRIVPYDLLVWAGGVAPASILKNFGLPLDQKGGVIVNEFLEARPRIYAIGDCASFTNKKGRPLPKNVPVAESQARLAAKNIIADITRQKKLIFKPLGSYPYILTVGGKYALTDLVIVKFSGLFGWFLKQLVELRYLLFILPTAKAMRMWLRGLYYGTRND